MAKMRLEDISFQMSITVPEGLHQPFFKDASKYIFLDGKLLSEYLLCNAYSKKAVETPNDIRQIVFISITTIKMNILIGYKIL